MWTENTRNNSGFVWTRQMDMCCNCMATWFNQLNELHSITTSATAATSRCKPSCFAFLHNFFIPMFFVLLLSLKLKNHYQIEMCANCIHVQMNIWYASKMQTHNCSHSMCMCRILRNFAFITMAWRGWWLAKQRHQKLHKKKIESKQKFKKKKYLNHESGSVKYLKYHTKQQ